MSGLGLRGTIPPASGGAASLCQRKDRTIQPFPEFLRGVDVRLLALDVDGVLTPNLVYINADGIETKSFYVPDGLGLRMLIESGVQVSLISGRRSRVVEARARELGIRHAFDGVTDKVARLSEVTKSLGLEPAQVAYMGDDLPDLPPMKWAGCAIAPADGHALVRERADLVTERAGGAGAVREVCEWVLHASDRFDRAVERWVS